MKTKKYYFTYKTTNKKNGKFYYGCHITSNLSDGYLGSGRRLIRAVKKHGRYIFERKIIQFFNNKKDMLEAEKQLLSKKVLSNKDCYNLTWGGRGHWPNWKAGSDALQLKQKTVPGFKEECYKKISIGVKKAFARGFKGSFYGKTHTEEFKKMIGKVLSKPGKENSQYGKCWIYSNKLKENMSVRKEEVQKYIECGWTMGRNMSYKSAQKPNSEAAVCKTA